MSQLYNPITDAFTYYNPVEINKSKKSFIEDDLFGKINLPTGYTVGANGYVRAPDNLLEEEPQQNEQQELDILKPPTNNEQQTPLQYTSEENISKKINGKHKQLLSDMIDQLSKNDQKLKDIKDFLMDTAAFESSFDLYSKSKSTSASGWFGFIDKTRNWILNELGVKTSRKDFIENPELQIKAASKLYYNNLNAAKKQGILDAAHKKGYSTSDVMHAMWLNPTWARNFFIYDLEGGKDANGTDIRKYLNKIHGRK